MPQRRPHASSKDTSITASTMAGRWSQYDEARGFSVMAVATS
jgi:hypothetical protein